MEIMVYQTSQIPPRNELKHKIITKKSAICLAIKEKFPYLNGLKDLGLLSETELLVAKSKSSVEKAIYKGVELALNKPTNILHFYDYTFDDCYLERYPELNSIKRDLDAADKEEITAVVLQNEATSFSTSHNYMIPSSGAASPGSSTTEGTAMSEEPGQSSTECRGLIHTHIISTVDDLEAADNEEITAVALQNEVLSPLPYHNCMIPGSGAASPGNSTTEAFQDEAPSFSSNQNYMIPNSIVASQVSSTTEGSKDGHPVVTLFPKEKCTCPSSRTCCHTKAARESGGFANVPKNPRKLQMTVLQTNKGQKGWSGRKYANVQGKPFIEAPEDTAANMDIDISHWMDQPKALSAPKITRVQSVSHNKNKAMTFVSNDVEEIEAISKNSMARVADEIGITVPAPWDNSVFPFIRSGKQKPVSMISNICIYDYDLNTLKDSNWLNDRVIDGFIASRAILCKEIGCFADIFPFSCFVDQALINKLSDKGLEQFLESGVMKKDIWMIPINDRKCHWILIIVVLKMKLVVYFDSLHDCNVSNIERILMLLDRIMFMECAHHININEWSFHAPKDIPKQINSSDCGAFVCAIAHVVAVSSRISYTQKDMPQIRKWLADELIKYDGKSHLEKKEKYLSKQAITTPPLGHHLGKIVVLPQCPKGFKDTLSFCSQLLKCFEETGHIAS